MGHHLTFSTASVRHESTGSGGTSKAEELRMSSSTPTPSLMIRMCLMFQPD